jgi:HSP20 family protein
MARTNTFRGFVDMMTEMERARRLGTTGSDPHRASGEQTAAEAWVPAADIYSVGDDLVIRLDVPGVHGSQIEVTLADGVLTIAGERVARPPAGATVYALERQHGTFRRHMILPLAVEQEDIEAVLEDGVVEITVSGAGAAVAGPDRIPVSDRSRPRVLRGREPGFQGRGTV